MNHQIIDYKLALIPIETQHFIIFASNNEPNE